MSRWRNTLLAAIAVTLTAVFTPTAAWAYTALGHDFRLQRMLDNGSFVLGSGVKSIYNSGGQKVGEYELEVHYVVNTVPSVDTFIAYANVRVKDTLLGNGRGVKVKLMTKTGSSTSNVIGTYKGASGSWSQWWSDQTPAYTGAPVWAFDVDHGEDWSGNPFVYTGHYDRFVKQSETTKDNWPFFNVWPNPGN